ncbi:MAG: hypothetical protein CML53_03550 [Rhodobacteraceae bacterium]|jgi:hypothetical protein|nr:hypothetical protein [Paracoccaceae bacterium]NCV49019.1 DUF2007 domain-containing protein [Rhodobacterales bacterium]NDA29811.1 DUF2007 domain-containing protein [Alphaproteobacteria bacterium]MCH1562250.1 DUF2007 domain-containing protein [Paracoccaceae bacterium]MDP6192038.1 DUF2007 domain-containing protein [Paracoccaceae bacterium]|tara:strand:+ start:1006 stop:1224 length:219 start_codon:yes stop_codon:yes gene_type:complete
MKELMSTNDITKFVYAETVLNSNNIVNFALDVNISVLEGSIGILPRRLMVMTHDYDRAVKLLTDFGLDLKSV